MSWPLDEASMEHLLRIEPSHRPYRSRAPPSTHQVPNGAPCPSRTDLDRIQADHIAGNAYRAEWSLAADLNRALLLTKQARRRLRLRGTLRVYGAESGSPTRLACLEDKCLKRSANPAHCKAIRLSKNRCYASWDNPRKAKGPISFAGDRAGR
jgi:hypothetical protein